MPADSAGDPVRQSDLVIYMLARADAREAQERLRECARSIERRLRSGTAVERGPHAARLDRRGRLEVVPFAFSTL